MYSFVDRITVKGASGWVFSPEFADLRVQAWTNGQCLAESSVGAPRPDVAAAHGHAPRSLTSGFTVCFPDLSNCNTDFHEITLVVVNDNDIKAVIGKAQLLGAAGLRKAERAATTRHIRGPFPGRIIAAVNALWPGSFTDTSNERDQRTIAEKIALLAKYEPHSLNFVTSYVRFLRAVWSHCLFVQQYFPTVDARKEFSAMDANCKPNSAEEMISVAHHLFVLRSCGVQGEFAEFGCFKGYSSAMLSFACEILGLKMHIFDSFAGLPTSESTFYQAGSFRGEINEVRRNIEQFGAPSAVSYHEGFFQDTVPSPEPKKICCLWMDVDLASSACDVMAIADRLDKGGAVFSHECEPHNFNAGSVLADRRVGGVVPPIIDKFGALGWPITGNFVSGKTGAFWNRDAGHPVLSSTVLQELIASI